MNTDGCSIDLLFTKRKDYNNGRELKPEERGEGLHTVARIFFIMPNIENRRVVAVDQGQRDIVSCYSIIVKERFFLI